MVVWKFPIKMYADFDIAMPKGAQLLSVHCQQDQPMLWALVDPDAVVESRSFRLLGTGHAQPTAGIGRFVGTFLVSGGDFVFHLFEATH